MSNLLKFAEEELKKAGMFDDDSSYGGMLGHSTMKLMKAFCSEGHSGMSASLQVQLFTRLASWKPLSPLTNDPDEWMDVTNASVDRKAVWQSRRCPSCFSEDGGKTFYDIDDKEKVVKPTKEHKK